jgi:hypothetical protein
MESLQYYIDQMEVLLDELIRTARNLRHLSEQVVSEQELTELQKKQNDLVGKLEELDQKIQTRYASDITEEMHQKLSKKVKEFQTLNQEFIQNYSSSHGVIQFELKPNQEREEQTPRFKFRSKSSEPS